jgi:hypothetical protein
MKIPLFFITLLSIIVSATSATAQKTTMQAILATARQDERLLNSQKMATFTQQQKFNLPIIRKIDLRLGINGNLTTDTLDGGLRNEDYYALQVSPNSFRERKYQRALQKNIVSTYDTEQNVWLLQAFYDRYMALLSLYFSEQQIEQQVILEKLLKQKKEFFQNALRLGVDVKVKEIVALEKEHQQLSDMSVTTTNNVLFQKERLSIFLKNNVESIDFEKFITPDDIQKSLSRLLTDSTQWQHPSFSLREATTNLLQAEHRLETVKEKQVLSFVQLGYDNYAYEPAALRRFNPNNNIALRIGLTAPIPANNNLKRAKTAIEWKEEVQDLQFSKSLMQKQIRLQIKKIENLLRVVNENSKEEADNIFKKLLANKSLMAQTPAEDILDINIILAEKALQNIEQKNNLTIEYLKLLEMTGVLLKNSDKNMLAIE